MASHNDNIPENIYILIYLNPRAQYLKIDLAIAILSLKKIEYPQRVYWKSLESSLFPLYQFVSVLSLT